MVKDITLKGMYGGLLSMNCRNRDHNRTKNNCYYIPLGTYPKHYTGGYIQRAAHYTITGD